MNNTFSNLIFRKSQNEYQMFFVHYYVELAIYFLDNWFLRYRPLLVIGKHENNCQLIIKGAQKLCCAL